MLLGCFKGVLKVFQGDLEVEKRIFQACFKELSGVHYQHFKGVSRIFQGSV